MPNGDLQHVLLSISLFFCRFLCRHINISSSEPRHSNFASGGSTIQSKHSTRIICNCLDWYSFRTSFENVRSLENLIQLNETETRNVVHCDYISYLWLYVFLQRLFLACYMLFFIIPFEQKRDKFKSGKMDSKWITVLKELLNCILRAIVLRSLFCLIRIYIGLHFLQFLLKN